MLRARRFMAGQLILLHSFIQHPFTAKLQVSVILWFIATTRIADPGAENYQRNSDGEVGGRLILLSAFALQFGRWQTG